MIQELYEALTEAKISPEKSRAASQAVENWVRDFITAHEQGFELEKIIPLEKENTGIRSEIKILSETMKVGFQSLEKTTNVRFDAVEKSTNARFDALEKSTNARFDALEKSLDFQQRILWVVIALNVTLAGAVLKTILIP